MSLRVLVENAFLGVAFDSLDMLHQSQQVIVESGVLGGDMIPNSYVEPTLKAIENQLDKIAIQTGDNVDVKVVGSVRFGMETRALFGDLDVILRMKKPETLSRIKKWVSENDDITNIRDIKSKKSGHSMDPDQLGDQFSFLYPMHNANGDRLTIKELRSNFDAMRGQPHFTYRNNHDQRIKLESNLKNLGKDKDGYAMIQVDVMRVFVDGMEFDGLVGKAQKMAQRLEEIDVDGAVNDPDLNGDGKIAGAAELRAWLQSFLDGGEVQDFQSHYDFLKKHGELQGNDDQRLLAAIHLLSSQHEFDSDISRRFGNSAYRYGFHPDSLQMIYFLANQLGTQLNDDNFDEDTLKNLVNQAKLVGTEPQQTAGYSQTNVKRVDAGGQAKKPQGMVSDKLTVDIMRNPAEFFRMLKGKMKTDVKQYVIQNTKNKRADEGNPDALYKNFGTRRVKQV